MIAYYKTPKGNIIAMLGNEVNANTSVVSCYHIEAGFFVVDKTETYSWKLATSDEYQKTMDELEALGYYENLGYILIAIQVDPVSSLQNKMYVLHQTIRNDKKPAENLYDLIRDYPGTIIQRTHMDQKRINGKFVTGMLGIDKVDLSQLPTGVYDYQFLTVTTINIEKKDKFHE